MALRWAVGLTTVPKRRHDLLPRTLASLKAAGFQKDIHLFVDGDCDGASWRQEFGLEVTTRWPAVLTVGNWILSMMELYVRVPNAHRYMIVQDDLVTCRNAKEYLERCPYPDKSYGNLYTFPQNQALCPSGYTGWYPSNQRGLGALALIFDRPTLMLLLTSPHLVRKPADAAYGWRSIDGAIVESMTQLGITEYVHNPSLVQHTGVQSTMIGMPHPLAPSFPGETFDALSLL